MNYSSEGGGRGEGGYSRMGMVSEIVLANRFKQVALRFGYMVDAGF
ncbi:MAG: hypothetical protein K0R63_1038 [Rickettsiales bacterium]|jgi:hypothetical protein|nr:hypothetical protein [Rickettsiales bacterium]